MTALELRDKVSSNARVVFVGINPAIRSAQVGHYYAHPSNKFWQLLSESGLAPRRVTAEDDDWLATQGFGFTDVAKRPTVGAGDLAKQDWRDARARLEEIGRQGSVQYIVFVSKFAARCYYGDNRAIEYGESRDRIGGAGVWFLPSTSGQSYRDTSYAEKLAEFKRLKRFLDGAVHSGARGQRVVVGDA